LLPRALKWRSKIPRRIDRAVIGWPTPFASGRRRPDTVGFSLPPPPPTRSTWSGRLPSPSSAPRSVTTEKPRSPSRSVSAPLLGFDVPLQRLQMEGARITRRFQPPARSVLRDSHPFDVLLHPSSGRACFIPSCAPGVHPFAAASHRPFGRFETSEVPLSRSLRPPLFRAPELRTGSLSKAFSPIAAARTFRPRFLPALESAKLGCPNYTNPVLRRLSPRQARDALGRSRGTRSLPS
jgi:hypothetical protein